MSADAYFRMGSTHAICQDYAVSGTREGRPFALLSDGCSGIADRGDPGSPHTDFGARFLVRSALRQLPEVFEGRFPYRQMISDALAAANAVGLGRAALDATLLAATHCGDFAHTFQTGDGVIAVRHRSGAITYFATSFGQNAPYYLSYLLDLSLQELFMNLAKTATVVCNTYLPRSGWGEPNEQVHQLENFGICNARWFDATEVDLVLLFSDGVESFFDKDSNVVPLESVLEQIFSLKNLTGEFLTRRCNAFLHRFCAETGWKHADDFSVAGIHLGDCA